MNGEKKEAIRKWPPFLLFLCFFYHCIPIFISQIKLLGNDIQTIGNYRTDTFAIDKDEFAVHSSDEHIINDGDYLDLFPVTGIEEEKDLFPFSLFNISQRFSKRGRSIIITPFRSL